MPNTKSTDPGGEQDAKRRLAARIEQAAFDYVYDTFGRSEAEDPSWSIRALAAYLADALTAGDYEPKHKIHYDYDDEP